MFKKLKRGLCLLLVCCLLLTLVPLSAVAGDTEAVECAELPESGLAATMRERRADAGSYIQRDASFAAASADQIAPLATPPAAISSIFPDPAIAQLVAEGFGRATSARITQAELNEVWSFELIDANVQNLQGLQFMPNLSVLDLGENRISDLRPISGLRQLEGLGLDGNQISDIGPLSGLTQLVVLWLCYNQISNLQPLAGLTNLVLLEVSNNRVSNLAPLSGLTRLEWLELCSNQISNIGPLSGLTWLELLCLGANQINDIGPLSRLNNLIVLSLADNRVQNLAPLSGLINLEILMLWGNQITDLRPLRGLTRVHNLTLHEQAITLSPARVVNGSLVVESIVRDTDGTFIPWLGAISHGGTYQQPNITWTNLPANATQVQYDFSWHVIYPRNLNAGFSGTVTIPLADTPFSDVNRGQWFNSAVAFVYNEGVMVGTGPVTFGPTDTLTRAQVARMLWNMDGQPAVTFRPIFTDVPATDTWYRDAVVWAGENGIVLGYQGRFNPHESITREQFAIMMFRYARFTGQDITMPINFSLNQFTDHGAVSSWALSYMRWAVYAGLITGNDGRITPQGTAVRAEAAAILMRYMQRFGA